MSQALTSKQIQTVDREFVEIYARLVSLMRDESLEPFQYCGAAKAAATLWQVVNGISPDLEAPNGNGLSPWF
jgi:hypothetical protein